MAIEMRRAVRMVYMRESKGTASEGRRKRMRRRKKRLPNAVVSLVYKFDFSSSGT